MSKEDSKEEEEAAASVEEEVCANCGIAAAGDDIKLKSCACKLVKYCTVNCQKNHRPQHKKMCKMGLAKSRRAIRLRCVEKALMREWLVITVWHWNI